MAAKTKCPICDEPTWGFDLTRHLFAHLPYQEWTASCKGSGFRCWCGRVYPTFGWWAQHLRENGGWKAHYAACALGLNKSGVQN